MRKKQELSDPNSCLNRAGDDEMVFVLLGRDVAAPAAIREWVRARLMLGKNVPFDPQLTEAVHCVEIMEEFVKSQMNPMDAVIDRYMRGTSTQDDLEVMAAQWFMQCMANKKKKSK